jgi:autotransporter-associated beta strand protein
VFDLASYSDGVASLAGASTGTVKNSTIGGTSTLTVNPATGVSTTFAGVIAGTNGGAQGNMALVKSGLGTLTLTGANTYSGSTTISGGKLIAAASSGSALGSTTAITVNSGGTLSLGASDQINDSATITLDGGTIEKGDFSEGTTSSVGMGALTLTATGSHIDFGTGTVGILTFASLNASTFTLTIDNWTGTSHTIGNGGTDRLIFDSDQSGNLASFNFTGFGPGGGVQFALGGGYFEVVAMPEPSTWVGAALSIGGLIFWQIRYGRRRLRVAKASSAASSRSA